MHNERSHLLFPLVSLPASGKVIVRDLDIVGVGGLRRQQLETLHRTCELELWTYEGLIPQDVHSIYQEELLRTLQWLRPFHTKPGPFVELVAEHRRLFQALFPVAGKYLGAMADRVRDEYLQDMSWSSWLLQDHWRYFPGFIRHQFPQNKALQQISHWEWVQAWLEVQAFHYENLGDAGTLSLNPSLQTVDIGDGGPALGMSAGLYAGYFDESRGEVRTLLLDADAAELIDLLREDRKFSPDQLAEMLTQHSEQQDKKTRAHWDQKVTVLIGAGVLILNS